ncbi:hypothetical protein CUMW_212500 [Citrus unshiu]|uniref:Uncharacterized protein n=1 Tax=Citrus unshiu TaxID=55188 RepID=A0A2H5QB04_CITUN|nr:hypothetical protein CUMW_212500 [Citrus unshiu]
MWADHMLPWRKEFGINTIMQVTMVCRVSSLRVCESLCSKVTGSNNCTFIENNFGFARCITFETAFAVKFQCLYNGREEVHSIRYMLVQSSNANIML